MFDNTAAIALGSLVIILGGALIFYLGLLIYKRAGTEYGKEGFPRKYSKINYYKQGALFLEDFYLRGITAFVFMSLFGILLISACVCVFKHVESCLPVWILYCQRRIIQIETCK